MSGRCSARSGSRDCCMWVPTGGPGIHGGGGAGHRQERGTEESGPLVASLTRHTWASFAGLPSPAHMSRCVIQCEEGLSVPCG